MAASQRSLRLTDAYRRQLVSLAAGVEAQARELWPRIEDFDTSQWPEQMAATVARAQTRAVRLTSGYLGAYLRSETGKRGIAPAIDSRRYAGVSRDGRLLAEALRSPFIAVLGALADHRPADEALRIGLVKGVRFVGYETVQTSRDALADTVEADERFTGQRRSVSGTCAACMALSGTPEMEVHPGCECVGQPVVAGVRDLFPLATGAALFRAMSPEEQDAKIGPEAAQLVREGDADLRDFVAHSKTESDQPNWITQKPAEDVTATN